MSVLMAFQAHAPGGALLGQDTIDRGRALVAMLKAHLLEVMAGLTECRHDGGGARNTEIEAAAGLALALRSQDHYLTWSVLMSLAEEGKVLIVPPPAGLKKGVRYRLASPSAPP